MNKEKDSQKSGKLFKIIIGIAILLISFSVFYYFVIFLPHKEDQRIEVEKDQKEEQKLNLNKCLQEADYSYRMNWARNCEKEGTLSEDCKNLVNKSLIDYMKEKSFADPEIAKFNYYSEISDCSCETLMSINAEKVENFKKDDEDNCFKMYPQ